MALATPAFLEDLAPKWFSPILLVIGRYQLNSGVAV